MRVQETITAKITYTDVKLVSENNGAVVLNAKRGDNGHKVIIYGQRLDDEATKKSLLASSKKGFRIPQHEFLQKYS